MSHLIPDDVTENQRNLIREAMDIWSRLADIPVTEDDSLLTK